MKLVYEVGPESFLPPPTVKSALLNIKRKHLFFDFKFKAKYLAFISCLLEKPDLSVKTALKSIFRKSQVRSISEKFGLNLNAQIVCLSPSQWLNCFWKCWKLSLKNFILRSSKSGGCQDDFLVWCRLFLSCRITVCSYTQAGIFTTKLPTMN